MWFAVLSLSLIMAQRVFLPIEPKFDSFSADEFPYDYR